METKKFTFKPTKPTGKYSSFFQSNHDIKFKRKVCGSIGNELPHKIRLMIIKDGSEFNDDNPNCDWMWITLKKQSTSIDEAKNFLNKNIDRIFEVYNLHFMEK